MRDSSIPRRLPWRSALSGAAHFAIAAGAVAQPLQSVGLSAHRARLLIEEGAGHEGPGAADYFGFAVAAADFNGDGVDDLAVGIPGDLAGRGLVTVAHGSPGGYFPFVGFLMRQGEQGLPDTPEFAEEHGYALAAGDFDGDGFDDLAIGRRTATCRPSPTRAVSSSSSGSCSSTASRSAASTSGRGPRSEAEVARMPHVRWRSWLLLLLVGCSRSPAAAPTPDASLPAAAAAPAATAPAEGAPRSADVQLAPPDEPGQKLVVTGVLIRAEERTPIPGHRFRIYQADATGDYRAKDPADERTARLSADVTTDADGRFTVRTILPGVYGTPPGDPHLHLEVSGARPPMHVVYFDGFVQESTVRWQKTTEQAHIIAVTRSADGALTGHLKLPVRGVSR